MQNSYDQINKHWSVVVIILLTPLLLWAAIPILPTHDDWTSLTSPSFEPLFSKERWLFFGYHWRPFDSIFGYILGLNPTLLFPLLNHICVVLGHATCSVLIYRLLSTLGFHLQAVNIATLLFFITPASMATVLAVDSMNQIYALMWGLLSFLVYIKQKSGKYVLWIAMVFTATLCKENGLMWALISPIWAYGFNYIGKQRLKKDITIGIMVMITYAIVIMLQPKDIIIHPEYEPGMVKALSNSIKFLFTSFITIDYVYLLHQPSRNLLLALGSFLFTLPFSYFVFIRQVKIFRDKKIICTILSLLIAVSPHIITVFSMMHTYAGLPMIVTMMAYAINKYEENTKAISVAFMLFAVSALAINIHLWHESYISGIIGKKMAVEAIHKTGIPMKNVYLIIIEDDTPKLSSFCVIPYEAFGWGIAARHETEYQWPEIITDTIIQRSPTAKQEAERLSRKVLSEKRFDGVWIVDHKNINVVKK